MNRFSLLNHTLQFHPCLIFHLFNPVNSHFSLFSFSYWYCCVDVSVSRKMLVTGDNVGKLTLLSLDGQKVRVHPTVKMITGFVQTF